MPTKNKHSVGDINVNDVVALLEEALEYERVAFAINDSVNGADLVQWFAGWRQRVKKVLGEKR